MVFKTEKSEDNALSKKKRESALMVRPEKKFNLTYNDKKINKSTLNTTTNH